MTVAVGILPARFFVEHDPALLEDSSCIGPGQDVRSHVQRFRPLGVLSSCDARDAEDAALLLQAAGIGDDQAGV